MGKDWWKSGKSYLGFDSKKSKYKSSLGWSGDRLYDNYYSSYHGGYGYGYSSWGGYDSSYVGYSSSKSVSEKDINDIEHILSKAYKSTRDMVVILDFPFNVDITFSNIENSCDYLGNTRRRRIFIPTTVLDEPETSYTETEKIGIFCGLGIHEAAHLKYTSFNIYNKFRGRLNSAFLSAFSSKISIDGSEAGTLSPEEQSVESIKSLILCIVRLIEDERVEDCLLKERPGYSSFIEKSKFWTYKNFIKLCEGVLETCEKEDKEPVNYLINLFRVIRFPENLDVEFLEKYSSSFEELSSILETAPTSTKDSCILGYKIYELMKRQFDKLDFLKNIDGDNNNAKFSKSIKMLFQGHKGALSNSLEAISDDIRYGNDTDSGLSVPSTKISEKLRGKDNIIPKLITGMCERGTNDKAFFEKVVGNATKYKKIVSNVKKYVPSIRKLIKVCDKNYEFSIHGCRSGILDTTKLAEAYQGVPQVYIRQGKVTTPKTTVCILVDESGSMKWNNKEGMAREGAILLNEALKNIPGVDLYIYGHTADTTFRGSTNIMVYREGNAYINEAGLAEIQGRNENRDGNAIEEVAARVRKHTKSHCLMFILSDGEPAACHYYGDEVNESVRKIVNKTRQDDFDIVQITIDGNLFESKRMFGNKYVVDLRENISNLPIELSKVIKKCVLNNMKSTITT